MTNPHWLQSLQTLVATGSFTRAAEQLNLTQAAVSQHIRQLEEKYGILLIRHSKGVELTPVGNQVLQFAEEVAQAGMRLDQRLAATDSLHGEVGLVTPGSSGLLLYPHLLQLQRQHPGLVIRHRFAPDSEVLQAVLENQYQLGLLTFKPEQISLNAVPLAEEPLELVYPAGCKLQSWQDLMALGFIDHPDGKAMATRLLSRHFPANPGIASLPCSGYSNQISLLLQPVALGLGFTVLPRYARQAFAEPSRIAVLACPQPVIDKLWAIHRSEWPLPARCALVLNSIKAQLQLSAGQPQR